MTKELRTTSANLKVRGKNDENKIIEGYFAVFNQQTELFPGYYEKVGETAFDGILGKDIKALFNHDDNLVLGRTTNNTLELKVDGNGLYGRIFINEMDTEALNLYERVKRGDINQCSFGFYVNKQESEWKDDDLFVTLEDVELLEVSIVTFPAYENTKIAARSRFENAKKEKIDIRKQKLKEKLYELKNFNK